MNHWVILPILGPLLVALALMVWHGRRGQLTIAAVGLAAETMLAVWLFGRSLKGGLETYQPGNLLPPLGSVLVLDQMAALVVMMVTALGAAASARCLADPRDDGRGDALALIQIALAGLGGAVLAGELLNIWSLWSLGLVALSVLAPALRRQAFWGGIVLLVALVTCGLLAPTLTLADLTERRAGSLPGAVLLSAAFALWLWQPDDAPAALSALFRLCAVAVLARLTLLLPLGSWPVLLALLAAVPALRQPGQRLQVALCLLVMGGFALGSEAEIAAGLWALCAAGLVALLAPAGDTQLALIFQSVCLIAVAGLMLLATDHWPVRVALLAGIPALILATGLAIRRLPGRAFRPGHPLAAVCVSASIAAGVVAGVALGVDARVAAFVQPASTHIEAIARQLHNRQDYTTAVMGLPESPALTRE